VSEEQIEELRTRHCYSLTLTAVEGGGNAGDEDDNRDEEQGGRGSSCADTLEVSSINRSREASSTSPVAGIARSISKCWRESGESDTEPGRILISIEASVPSSFPSRHCKAKLELQQYLKYPLGSKAIRGGSEEIDASSHRDGGEEGGESSSLYLDGMYEHFLCRTWTKEIEVLRPLKVESFVSNQSSLKPEAFLSVTVGNTLPNEGETSKCILAVRSFQLLSDPPESIIISQVFPKRSQESKEHQKIHPGTEYSFVIRTSFTDLGQQPGHEKPREKRKGGNDVNNDDYISVDLLLSVSSSVSSKPLIFIHHTKIERHRQSPVQMEITHVGKEVEESSGLLLSSLQCLIKNHSASDKTFWLKKDEEQSRTSKAIFMDTQIPVGVVRGNSTKTVTCSVIPFSDILEVGKICLVDEQGKVYSTKDVSIDCT
jgi:hypothetical protein